MRAISTGRQTRIVLQQGYAAVPHITCQVPLRLGIWQATRSELCSDERNARYPWIVSK